MAGKELELELELVKDKNIQYIDNLIIGSNFSVIPLIREMQLSNQSYLIISSGDSIWEKLEKADRLDFDLVSSLHASMYSFELINQDVKTRFPTAKEYHEFIKKYKSKYIKNSVDDWVEKIENYDDYSLVYTRNKDVYRAKSVVLATNFKRRVVDSILSYDFKKAENKTVAFTSMGDSGNLIMSKIIPKNNRIILITNGFFCLDKLLFHKKKPFALEDLEFHNFSKISLPLYREILGPGVIFSLNFKKLSKLFFGSNFFLRHPLCARHLSLLPSLDIFKYIRKCCAAIYNGLVVIKYWPIDTYRKLFDNKDLEKNIKKGYLLNDLCFFIENNLIEVWPKNETKIDYENKVIICGEKFAKYDDIIEGDHEQPNLPEIIVKHKNNVEYNYQYSHRDVFMGVVPRDLKNIFFLGYTRPSSGGLENIIEMQCLFVHRMLDDLNFRYSIYENLSNNLTKYNHKYYPPGTIKQSHDHLVFYGHYTEEMAKLIEINPRIRDCRSLCDLGIYFFFPNHAFKYRQRGRYKVEGVRKMVKEIYKEHYGYSIIKASMFYYLLLFLMCAITLFNLPISFPIKLVLSIFLIIITPIIGFVTGNSQGIHSSLNSLLIAGICTTLYTGNSWFGLGTIVLNLVIVYAARKFGWTRTLFNDTRHKKGHKHMSFFDHYCKVFRKLEKEKF